MHFKQLSERDPAKDLHTLGWIHEQLKGHYGAIAYLSASNALEAFMEVYTAVLSMELIDAATKGDNTGLIRSSVLLFTVLAGPIVLNFLFQIVEESVVNKLRISFQNRALRHFFTATYEREKEYHTEEVLNRLFSDTGIVSEGIVDIIPTIIYFLVEFVVAVITLIYMDARFTLLFVVASLLLGAVFYAFRGKLKGLHKEVQGSEDRLRSFLQDVLSNSLVIRIFRARGPIDRKTGEYQDQYYSARMKRTIFNHAAGSGMSIIFTLGYWGAMLWGAWGIFAGRITYGTLVAMMELVGKIQMPMTGMTSMITETFKILASSERIMELEDSAYEGGEREETDGRAAISCMETYQSFREIDICDVSFSYGEHDVLSDVNLVIRKGDIVSLTGLSGGGKSTLFLLILNAYHPTKGTITFRDMNGEIMEDAAVRPMITYVPQENHLFSGTICDNITFFEEKPDLERVDAALRTACADEFVNALPDGVHSELREKGQGLSEGQMQRLAIARAIYSGAPILLMDEATSALDAGTEAEVLENISKLENKTCLMVTHRGNALEYSSRHFEMEGNAIRETTKGDAL